MRLRFTDMNIGIASVVGRLKKNRKYDYGTRSLMSIKIHTEDLSLTFKKGIYSVKVGRDQM